MASRGAGQRVFAARPQRGTISAGGRGVDAHRGGAGAADARTLRDLVSRVSAIRRVPARASALPSWPAIPWRAPSCRALFLDLATTDTGSIFAPNARPALPLLPSDTTRSSTSWTACTRRPLTRVRCVVMRVPPSPPPRTHWRESWESGRTGGASRGPHEAARRPHRAARAWLDDAPARGATQRRARAPGRRAGRRVPGERPPSAGPVVTAVRCSASSSRTHLLAAALPLRPRSDGSSTWRAGGIVTKASRRAAPPPGAASGRVRGGCSTR